MTKIKAYKGFNADMTCRGFQFEVGKTYTHSGKVEACRSGFHACENPIDVWDYYPIIGNDGKLTRFAEVELSGDASRDGDKIAAAEITIKAELTLPDFIRRAVDAVIAATKGKGDDPSGYGAQIGSSGNYSRIGSSGDRARIGSSGDRAQIGSSGDGAQIGSSGDGAQIGSSGDNARIGSSGYGAQIVCEGKDAVVAVAGRRTTVSGAEGAWISLASFDDHGNCQGFATGCIGKDGLKPGVPYRAVNCKLVEVK